jgi:hypothetical protein
MGKLKAVGEDGVPDNSGGIYHRGQGPLPQVKS